MNTLKLTNPSYQAAKLSRRNARRKPRHRIPQLTKLSETPIVPGEKREKPHRPKPFQPTILKLSTARRLAYLEQHGLTPTFADGNLVIEHDKFRDSTGKVCKIENAQSVGV